MQRPDNICSLRDGLADLGRVSLTRLAILRGALGLERISPVARTDWLDWWVGKVTDCCSSLRHCQTGFKGIGRNIWAKD